MTTSGPAHYFDGVTSARHDVTVELAPAAMIIRAVDGTILGQWGYAEIEALSAPEGLLRIGRLNNPTLARLEVQDPDLAHAIDELSVPIDRSGVTERRGRRKVVFWTIAATVSLVLMAVFGVPELADRLAPLVPYGAERRLGLAVDSQVRSMLDDKRAGARFECGNDDAEKKARAAFDKMFAKLETAAELPLPIRIAVLRKADANAITLPGGIVYVFSGLIDKSDTPDELAGVIAHELGHVAHRDGTRSVLSHTAMSFLFGMLLGDFVGGGAVLIAAKTVLSSSYSRDVEASADGYAVDLMYKVQGDPRALGTILNRIAGTSHPGPKLLLDHPETKDRVAAINAMAQSGPMTPLIDKTEWADIKRICSDRETK
jgi:Zn-dependent protease with chaperone function